MTEASTVQRVGDDQDDPIRIRLAEIRRVVPEAFPDGTFDTDALKAAIGVSEIDDDERYIFTWAGKREALRALRAKPQGSLVPDEAESVRFADARHLFLEGDNLEVMKLLYRSYFNTIKLVYIDPPYNKGKDFVYPDNYRDPLKHYLELSGQVDGEGNVLTSNPEKSGRYHSSWLSMMYPRLHLARQLLSDDGIIIVSIDDTEFANLRLMMNEIFGEENFIGTVVWNSTKSVTNTALISVSHTYNLIFARQKEYFTKNRSHFRLPEPGEGFANPDNDPRGPWKADPFQVGGVRPNQQYEIVNPKTGKKYKPNRGSSWKNELKVFERLLADNRIVFGASGEAGPQRKRFEFEAQDRGRVVKTLWDDVDTTTNATAYLRDLLGEKVFDNPKPVDLIQRFIQLGVHDPQDAVVLDFFAGSGTTADAVMRLNEEDGGTRSAVLVQLPEPTAADSAAYEAGYKSITEITKARLRAVIEDLENLDEADDSEAVDDDKEPAGGPDRANRGFRVFQLAASVVAPWEGLQTESKEEYVQALQLLNDRLVEGWDIESVLWYVALHEGLSLHAIIDKADGPKSTTIYRLSDPRSDRFCFVSLDERVDLADVQSVIKDRSDVFVCRDSALDDSAIANLTLQCELRVL